MKLKKKEIKSIIKKNNKFSDDEKIKGDFEKYSDKEILDFWNKTSKKYEDFLTILDLSVPRTLVEVEEILKKQISEYFKDYDIDTVLSSLVK